MKLSVVLATFNEEKNIGACLSSIKDLATEIIVVDGSSGDKTVEIAKRYEAKVTVTNNPPIFHINKQKALDLASHKWILQLDADERVTPELASEIRKILEMTEEEIEEYQQNLPHRKLFLRHQAQLIKRDGRIGTSENSYAAFFIPRRNYFLGKYLRYGGVYPDGVIRLVKKGKAHFPSKDVHEQIVVDGKVGWLSQDLLHMADPTFSRYLQRNSRYITLLSNEFKQQKIGKGPIQAIHYCIVKPLMWFLMTTIRHKGILDGFPGIIFSFFSALRFPRAYIRYFMN